MMPIICHERMEKPSGLWTSKLSGVFVEGDPNNTKFFVEGKVEIKELGGHLKAFFKGIKLIVRGTQQLKKKKKKKDGAGSDSDENEEEEAESSSSDSDEENRKKKEQAANQPPPEIGDLPKLHIFMTNKKPKRRMVDAHKLGAQLKISGLKDGIFGNDKEVLDYEANIVDIVDIFAYQGIVVLKLPQDSPSTEEPIIYGYVRLQSYRSIQIRTIEALHLNDLSDMLNKLTSLNEIGAASLALSSHSKKLIKPLRVYRDIAANIWLKYGKQPDDLIEFPDVLRLLDSLDLFFITVQARRLFDVIDLKKVGKIGLIDFENLLIAKDLLHEVSKEIVVMDVYDSLKVDPIDEDIILAKLESNLLSLEVQNKKEEEENKRLKEQQEYGLSSPTRLLSPMNNASANNTTLTLPPALNTEKMPENILKGTSLSAIIARKRKELQEKRQYERAGKKNFKIEKGLDYSGFIEAIQLLGYQKKLSEDEDEESMIRNAFCYGGGIKEKDIDTKYLTLPEFRKAYIKVAVLEQEFSKRNIKLEGGLFSEDRNRERLLRLILDAEDLYLNKLNKVLSFIETIKSEYRQKRDEKRRNKLQLKEKLLHEAQRFIAQRAQEKRLLMKKEQEEKSRKRIDDKILKNKLLLRQQENQLMKRLEIANANKEKEKLKLSEIRALGYDILDLSVKDLRIIPVEYYNNKEAQSRLNYVNLLDLSHNHIEFLPEKNFFYWLSETKKCKLSQNRIQLLPDDFISLTKVEILEMDSNRLLSLPLEFGVFTSLQRLNLSNNYLKELPLSIGQCSSLKYLNIHSNQLISLPNTLGSCFLLEFFDCSCNQLHELPEDLQYLIHLIHFDCNHNFLSSLPQEIGNCQSLQYLDVSINQITSIPESFQRLKQLEYINFENNSLLITSNCFQSLTNVKSLNMKKNTIHSLTSDFGKLTNLMFLDLSINQLITLPLEIGLLKYLQTLLLSKNRLTTLPLEIGSCKSLQLLDLSYNAIKGLLPETMGIIYSLIELNISYNEINELPESIIGFQEMKILNIQRCQLTKLPRTILNLEKLVELNLSNNRFTIFPIELSGMKALKKLNMYNNAIALLPRNINDICRLELDSINLGKNQLKALPVEFVELLETIPEVILNDNPWNLLPPKWGHRRGNLHSSDSILGYNLPDALDFLYAVRIIYNTCEEIWSDYGIFFYSNKLTIADFIQEIKNRIPKSWHDGLVKYAEHVFFQCKEVGIFVKWYLITPEEEAEIARKRVDAEIKKDLNVVQTRQMEELRMANFSEIYENSIETYDRLIQRTANRIEDNAKQDRYYQVLAQEQLHKIVVDHEKQAKKRVNRRERMFEGRKQQELNRLQEILKYDDQEYKMEKDEIKRRKEIEEAKEEEAFQKRMLELKSSSSASVGSMTKKKKEGMNR